MSGDDYNRNSLNATLAKFETKLDSALQAMVDQNRRIGVLEVAENKRIGAMVAIGSFCSAIGAGLVLVIDLFKGK